MAAAPDAAELDAMFLDMAQAKAVTNCSADTLLAAVHSGRLRAKRSGKTKDGRPAGKYLFSRRALQDWFEQLEDA